MKNEYAPLVKRLRDSAELRGVLPEWACKEMEAAANAIDKLWFDYEDMCYEAMERGERD